MHLAMTGFSDTGGHRLFAFEAVGSALGDRLPCSVKVDLEKARTNNIRLQELPLICRNLLDQSIAEGRGHDLTYTEAAMRLHGEQHAPLHRARRQGARLPFPSR